MAAAGEARRTAAEARRPRGPAVLLLSGGFLVASAAFSVGILAFATTSDTAFCISCHEMQVVAEQGWMHSTHYENPAGVVAGCADCHVPPEFFPMAWTKVRDGTRDVVAHFLGEADPERMDWAALGASARAKISDSACRRCHENLTPRGAAIKVIVAHRDYLKAGGERRCLDCHTAEFHGRFKELLSTREGR